MEQLVEWYLISLSLVRSTKREKRERKKCTIGVYLSLSLTHYQEESMSVYTNSTHRRLILHHHDDTKRKIGDILTVCNHRSLENRAPPTELWSFVCISYTIKLDFFRKVISRCTIWYTKRNLHVVVNIKKKRKRRHIDVSWENSCVRLFFYNHMSYGHSPSVKRHEQ